MKHVNRVKNVEHNNLAHVAWRVERKQTIICLFSWLKAIALSPNKSWLATRVLYKFWGNGAIECKLSNIFLSNGFPEANKCQIITTSLIYDLFYYLLLLKFRSISLSHIKFKKVCYKIDFFLLFNYIIRLGKHSAEEFRKIYNTGGLPNQLLTQTFSIVIFSATTEIVKRNVARVFNYLAPCLVQ